jgi:PKD domain-containing protein
MKTVPLFFLVCLLAFTVNAQSQRQPFKFTITAVDAKTNQPRSTFYLGESVPIRISLTNQSRVAHKIIQLPDTEVYLKLSSMEAYENGPKIEDSYYGGTGWARYENGITTWGSNAPRTMSIAPGQTVSMTIPDLGRHFFSHPFEEGTYTLTAKYNRILPAATTSVRIVVDDVKTIPLLEKLAAEPVEEGRDTVQTWARATLELVRHSSISGYVRDTEGRPLNEVEIEVTGSTETLLETRNTGGYRLEFLKDGGTYTITPKITYYDSPGEIHYTLSPASRSISLLNDKVTRIKDADFTAKRIRVSTNVASEDEGAKVKASSTGDWNYEPENVIDDFRFADGWYGSSDGWNDGTPHVFPDWIEVDFARVHRINWINVFTLPDDFNNAGDRDINDKFSQYGITDFNVEYWNGRTWRTVPGGAIRGNRNIWRTISFPPIATDKIRVVVLNSIDGETRITQIEAFHLNDLPQPKIAVVKGAKGHTDAPVSFRIAASDRDGTIQHYELDFGDDSGPYEWHFDRQKPGVKPLLTHSHIYESEGTYEVTLRVVDDSNERAETKILVTITDPPKRNANSASLQH